MRYLKLVISFGISTLLIIFLVRQINWPVVGVELSKANITPIWIVTLIWMFHFLLRSIRWQFFLPKNAQTTLGQRFASLMVGNLATFILPLRAGEFIRPFFLSRISAVPFATGFVSIVIERFLDLICVLLFFFIVSHSVPQMPSWAHDGAKGFSVIAFGIFVFILLAAFLPQFLEKLVRAVAAYLPHKIAEKIQSITTQVLIGASSIKSIKNFSAVIVLTFLIWVSNIIAFDYFLSIVSIPRDLGLSTTLTVLIALAVAAPSAPGFIGVYQVASIAAFSLYGISPEKATAYSLLNHLHQYVMIVGVGGFCLLRSGLSLGELLKKS